jgi:hypothetical protein
MSAVCGWLLSWSGGYEQRLLNWHRWTGVATAGAIVVAALLYRLDLKKAYRLCISAAFGVLLVASHFGGSLTHGSDYLTQYAPKPLRALLGGKPAPVKVALRSQAGSSPAAWADVIHPILTDKCVACHGPEKSKGSLRLDSPGSIRKGGETGPAIIPGKAAQSELTRRLLLPLDSDDHMPPDGKPQPTAEEIALLQWWIDAGAPATQTVAELKPPPAIADILAAKFKITNIAANPEPAGVPPKSKEEIGPISERLSLELGTPVTAISAAEPWLQFNASLVGTNFGDEHLAKLPAIGPNLRWLDLAGTAVSDAGLQILAKTPNLTRLHLERTGVTDAGLCHLTNLVALEYLNLYGTAVSDNGLPCLQNLPRLKHLFLWQTKVSPERARAFAEARTDQAQIQKWRYEIELLTARIKEQEMTVDLGTVRHQTQEAVPINNTCPVSGKPVQPGKSSLYAQSLVGFCCDDCKAKFDQDATPFLEKLGLTPPASKQGP